MIRPIWTPKDGITQSLLSKFEICRHRFYLKILGYADEQGFPKEMEYGNFMHEALEIYNFGEQDAGYGTARIKDYTKALKVKYPHHVWDINHWSRIAQDQFRIYCEHYQEEDFGFEQIHSEQNFRVPYRLPSGRSIDLRGKWDSVIASGKGKKRSVYLMDHKCKGKVDVEGISSTLDQDLQILFYYIALKESGQQADGVYYNVIRRPLAGGKHTIRKHKAKGKTPAETDEHYYNRLAGLIRGDSDHFFSRWKIALTEDDELRFKQQSLDAMLENLLDWWDSIKHNLNDPFNTYLPPKTGESKPFCLGHNKLHYRRPFGVYDGLSDGRKGDFHGYFTTGRKHNLSRVSTVFPELE